MKTMWKDAFVDGLIDEGRLADAKEKLLRLLGKRFEVPAAVRYRVGECADIAMVNIWFDRAITAQSVDDVFEGPAASRALSSTRGR
ncbi:MAG: hypothetical protein J2P25_20135 [Nocardiopsaceae bacterium]|nr:hypothetical protein [Nocardiopsaceae bacterium]